MIDTILFDFDGTLIDTNDIIKLALNETARKFAGKALSEDDYHKILGKTLKDQMSHISDGETDEMIAFYRDFYRSHRDEMTKEFEGVKGMLDSLAERNFKMGIVSSKGTDGIRHGLEKFGLKKYFSVVLSKYDVEDSKPHPEGIFKAMEFLGSAPESTLFVGDSIHDLLAAKNAGVPFVLVSWTIADFKTLKTMEPDYIIEKPIDMLEILKTCGKAGL